ncbi:PrsW family intramembrane metalloprotease [Plantibacter sp. YIM 135249]|uniref:PrsW family intramembrane metalloprotease n=1 Tax=Plantibacter sp. YIM 135249 TaxID=3423918 RepID=UPI003D35693B
MDTSPRPGRSRFLAVWPILAVAAWLANVSWIITQIRVDGVVAGLPLSIVVTLPMVGVFLWLDRWEREQPRRLLSAFAWGASFAALCSIWSQEGLQAFFDATVGTDVTAWFRPLVITPVTEEVFKGLFLIWLLVYRRRRITGLLDGIVYGGLVGAGFAFTEQILYFGRIVTTFAASDPSDGGALVTLILSFALRMVMVPFMHSFLVAIFGLGIAAAAGTRSRGARFGLAGAGLLVAIVLHGVWDWAGLSGTRDPFLIYKIYGAVMVPLFLAMLILALILRRREGKAIAAALPSLAREGRIGEHEVGALANLGERRRWRRDVRRRSGRAAARATGRYQAEASALAIRTTRSLASGTRDGLVEQTRVVADARAVMLEADARG